MKVAALLVAAGSSKRLKAKTRKPFIRLADNSILLYSLETLLKNHFIREVVVAVNKLDFKKTEKLCSVHKTKKNVRIVCGGERRADSVFNAFLTAGKKNNYVLIHDAARPFIDQDMINKVVLSAGKYKAAVAAEKIASTVKEGDSNNFITRTLDRSLMWQAQTPQVFKKSLLARAYRIAGLDRDYTDEASLIEALGIKVKLVPVKTHNIKITEPKDLLLARNIMKTRK